MPNNVNFAAHAMSDEHVDMLRVFWNAIDRVRRTTGQRVTLPCESDPDMWFSFDVTEQAHAALACLECPVIAECGLLADAPPQPREGIWAGRDYSRRETARLCTQCGKGWWPLGREGRARKLRLDCPECYPAKEKK